MSYNERLKNRVAVITGAGGIICSMFAKALAEKGIKVALLNRTFEKAEKYVNEIRFQGGIAKAYGVNVLNKQRLEEVHRQILQDFGPCDILINGAGGNHPGAQTDKEFFIAGDELDSSNVSFFDLKQDGFQSVLDLNFMGTLLSTQVFARDMIGRKNCTILNISSMNALTPLTKIPAYSGAKAAVSNFTQWLAVYFSKEGIRVNAIAPGFFLTAQNESLLYEKNGTPTARTEKILASTPMGRLGKAEELCGTLLYLIDEKMSGFVTGVVIPVDGGFSAYSGV